MAGRTLSDKLWLEVRAYRGQELEAGNMAPVINYVYNSGEPFESVAACTPSPREGMDRSVIRWFLGVPDPGALEAVKSQLEGRGFYVTREDPPDPARMYDRWAELQMTDFFARGLLPSVSQQQRRRTLDGYPDVAGNLAGALSSGGALWMSFRADRGAEQEVHGWAGKRESPGGGSGLLDLLSGFIGALITKPSGGSSRGKTTSGRSALETKNLREEAGTARSRASEGLLSCDARAYGTPDQINNIIRSLPFTSNALEVSDHGPLTENGGREGGEGGDEEGECEERFAPDPEPSTHRLKRTFGKYAPVLPLPLLPLLWWLGLWNPLRTFGDVLNTLPVLAAVGGSTALALWGSKNPIVMSVPELTLLTSLPLNLGTVPYEPGAEAGPSGLMAGRPERAPEAEDLGGPERREPKAGDDQGEQ